MRSEASKARQRAYYKEWYKKNKEKRIAYAREYRDTHREYYNNYNRSYYNENKDKLAQSHKEWAKAV